MASGGNQLFPPLGDIPAAGQRPALTSDEAVDTFSYDMENGGGAVHAIKIATAVGTSSVWRLHPTGESETERNR